MVVAPRLIRVVDDNVPNESEPVASTVPGDVNKNTDVA
jgi:hypothetical protein